MLGIWVAVHDSSAITSWRVGMLQSTHNVSGVECLFSGTGPIPVTAVEESGTGTSVMLPEVIKGRRAMPVEV